MDELAPEWLNADFLTECLQKEKGNKNLSVTHFTASSAVPAGNNYGSSVLRVKLEYKDSQDEKTHFLSLIIKAELTEGIVHEIFDMTVGEPSFYYLFLPKAKQFSSMSFIAKTYYSPRPKDIILEDLKEQGYIMADRTKQLDYDHCRLYMIAAANLHAVSVAVYAQNPELKKAHPKEIMFSDESRGKEMVIPAVKYGFKHFSEAAEKIDKYKKYSRFIIDIAPYIWDMMLVGHAFNEKALNTINQGDPWTTNMMFKYDNRGHVSQIKLLDFQCTRYGSPVNDLMFFIWSSANNHVKIHKLDELYNIYLDNLNRNLEQYGCDQRLSYQQLIENVNKLSALALYWAAVPIIINPDPVDFEIFFSKEEGSEVKIQNYFKKIYNDEFCKEKVPKLLESLEVNGVFDHLQNIPIKNFKRSF